MDDPIGILYFWIPTFGFSLLYPKGGIRDQHMNHANNVSLTTFGAVLLLDMHLHAWQAPGFICAIALRFLLVQKARIFYWYASTNFPARETHDIP